MKTYRMIGIVGFMLVVIPFLFGIWMMLGSTPRNTSNGEELVSPITENIKMHYIPYGFPLSVSLPKFNRTVAVGISFMVQDNDPLAKILTDDIDLRDGRFDAIITRAVMDAGDKAQDIDVLRRYLSSQIRDAVNLQIGSRENPTPVHEVLITSYAIQ